jgi:drug/metabolite transporter (DMT)-like permease
MRATTNPDGTWRAALAAITGSALVGLMPLCARLLYAQGLAASSMLFWRYGLALLALFFIAQLRGLDPVRAWRAGAWRVGLVGATLGAAQTLCFWESIRTLDTSIAELLFYTYPAVTLVLDRTIFKQPIRPLAVLCIAAILVGAGLITGPDLRGGSVDLRGLAWALPAPLIYAVYLAINARLLRRYPSLISAGSLFAGNFVTFSVAATFSGLDLPPSTMGWLLIVFIAVGPGALWMVLFTYSVPRLGASAFAILANAELVTVVAIGVLVLGEPVTMARATGGTLILIGILTRALSRRSPVPETAPRKPRCFGRRHPLPSCGSGRAAAEDC